MTQQDQLKIIKKGFTIIRMDNVNLKIKYKDIDHLHWKYYELKYASFAAMERDFKALLTLEDRISD